jgi:hypothetical protein
LGLNELTFSPFVAGAGGGPNPVGTEFAMEDFKFTTASHCGIPEPESLVLATTLAGELALGAWRKHVLRERAARAQLESVRSDATISPKHGAGELGLLYTSTRPLP